MCPVETEAAFQSSLGPFAVNKHKRASREGRRTGSHLINSQTLLQIMEAHAFITGEALCMSPFNLERLFTDLQGNGKSHECMSGSQHAALYPLASFQTSVSMTGSRSRHAESAT